jgi:hypothetical protein
MRLWTPPSLKKISFLPRSESAIGQNDRAGAVKLEEQFCADFWVIIPTGWLQNRGTSTGIALAAEAPILLGLRTCQADRLIF